MTIALPADLASNPRLDRWVGFATPGVVSVFTGKVEIGQGIATALTQIAAEEFDVAPSMIRLAGGDTALTPDEGFTAGSNSIEIGGKALRFACAEVRALLVEEAARRLGCDTSRLAVRDGAILRDGIATGETYWTLAPSVSLLRDAKGAAPKPVSAYSIVGGKLDRLDLPGKVFGEVAYLHDLVLPGMRHARVIRQPGREAGIGTIDEPAIRRAGKGAVQLLRDGNFVAVVGDGEAGVEAAAAAGDRLVTWQDVADVPAMKGEARWLLQQPSEESRSGAAEATPSRGARRFEATFTRPYVAHASMGPSCAIAQFEHGHLTIWSHTQGVFPLRAALARALKLDPAEITIRHVEGPGCYGHNGADDVAADAAIIAMRMPGPPVRVRWRREEEFGFEPVSPAMVVTVRALLDEAGRPTDWTQEIWAGPHTSRPGQGTGFVGTAALAAPTPLASGNSTNGGIRNGEPLYAIAATRTIHHLVQETPVRTSALRGLGATANVFAIESAIDELADLAGVDPLEYRLSILTDPRARRVVERVGEMSGWVARPAGGAGTGRGIAFARYKNSAAYAALVVDVEVDEEIRLKRIWCAVDGGLVVNPDGALNQLEGGIIQGASWALKEQVRLGGPGIASRDWESYPVIRFSDIPEIDVELVNPRADRPSLGLGEATGGPAVAAIANAASRALGLRLRDLPLTRERVMAAMLAG